MNKKRLIKAYSILKTIPAGNLDLKFWRVPGFTSIPSCNTIACAAGWLAMHPDFKKEGLRASVSTGYPIYPEDSTKGNNVGYEAMAKFFKIGEKDAERLFEPNLSARENRNDKRTVLRRFQRFFAENGIVA